MSHLRNLDEETEKQVEEMPITYDIETDYLYNKGMEKKATQMILNMLDEELLTLEQIARIAGVSIEYVQRVKEEYNR